ncbi:MAG TPA: phospholipid carrier-dependent glycosyltransferase [Candidatus Woesebacteria bacterium]|nr:phospholipid carrier-dependent glycosyltransferase [Candidatus Woesebacteria bacterium]HNS95180.1 phospholipid carrier-dependent glycosyltransferase [Candidatus Woesebacteria bacterium]
MKLFLSFLHQNKRLLLISLVLFTAFALRTYEQSWDKGGHLHPDERMLIMVADKIHFPDNLNPDFFNYGTLPIYLLKGTAQLLDSTNLYPEPIATYDGMLALGRSLSAFLDIGTVVLIFAMSFLLTRTYSHALLASLIYSIAFFPIQNSHFFVVDVPLTFFVTLLTFSLVWWLRYHKVRGLIMIGISLGLAVATKFTAILFGVGALIAMSIFIVTQSTQEKPLFQKVIQTFRAWVFSIFIVLGASLLTFGISMPYAFISPTGIFTHAPHLTDTQPPTQLDSTFPYPGLADIINMLHPEKPMHTRFLRDVRDQLRMNSDPYVFPYTLQYVTTKPYVYHLEQIIKWGLGPFISVLILLGTLFMLMQIVQAVQRRRKAHTEASIQLISDAKIVLGLGVVYGLYFVIVGQSAVKFMRYMLPLYPPLSIIAAYGLHKLIHGAFVRRNTLVLMHAYKTCVALCTIGMMVWTYAFMHIYTVEHTRIAATNWILSNIPAGKTLTVEHWDDRVPIQGGERYRYEEMTIYELPDNEAKWQVLMQKLDRSDYVVLASNRLYTPLPKLADCGQFKVCYPRTTTYYQKLFSGELGFVLHKEFTAYPRLGPWEIRDDEADESFTVYDHPKVMIFKNEKYER